MTLLAPGVGASPAEDAAAGCQATGWTLAGLAFSLLRMQEWGWAMSGISKSLFWYRKLLYPFCPRNKHSRKWAASCSLGDAGRWAGAPVGVVPEVQFEKFFYCYLPPAFGHVFMNTLSFPMISSYGRLFHISPEHVWAWGLSILICFISWLNCSNSCIVNMTFVVLSTNHTVHPMEAEVAALLP